MFVEGYYLQVAVFIFSYFCHSAGLSLVINSKIYCHMCVFAQVRNERRILEGHEIKHAVKYIFKIYLQFTTRITRLINRAVASVNIWRHFAKNTMPKWSRQRWRIGKRRGTFYSPSPNRSKPKTLHSKLKTLHDFVHLSTKQKP